MKQILVMNEKWNFMCPFEGKLEDQDQNYKSHEDFEELEQR